MALYKSYNMKVENICRLCLKHDEIMSPIFDVTNGEKNSNFYVELITSIAHVEIDEGDGLPSTMCRTCQKLVEKFYEFQCQVETSDKTLRSCLKLTQSSKQNVMRTSEINNKTKDIIYEILMPNNEKVQIWEVPNVIQIPSQSNEVIKDECINNQENIEDTTIFGNEISCQLCSTSFTSLSDLKKHVIKHCSIEEKQIFDNESVYISTVSDESEGHIEKIDNSYPQNITHRIKNSDEENRKNKLIDKKDDLKKIINRIKLRCKYCDKLFSKSTFLMHSKKCRNREKELICDKCGKHFKKRSELKYHKSTHTNSPLTCEYCSKQFRNSQSLSIHIKRHTHGTRFHCGTCDKGYYTNSELRRHIQKHLDKRKYPCLLCDMAFMSQPELNRHMKYHNGVKRFECEICFKSYYESGHLKVHQRVHTGERPFVCKICEKAFVTRSKLVRHTKIHEKMF